MNKKREITDDMAQVIEQTRERILHSLAIFPFLSSSLLHMSIGTSTSHKLWKPLLEDLLEEGKVVETVITAKSATGRQQTYTIYHLAQNKYTFGVN